MNKYLKTAILLLVFSQIDAQNIAYRPNELLALSKRWILVNNKIDKNEIFLTSYKTSKLKANTFVMSFVSGGKIEYDYETNFSFKSDTRIEFLDIVTDESLWEFDSLNNQISLTIKGGYSSLEDFKFKRSYKIERISDGFILHKVGEEFYEDLKQKARTEKIQLALLKKNETAVQIKQIVSEKQHIAQSIVVVDNVAQKDPNTQVITANLSTLTTSTIVEVKPVEAKITPVIVVDYAALSKDLLDKSKRWMLVKNKIERNDIFLTIYDESKLTINNLIMSFDTVGKIAYDYESDPKVRICAGVDFLDIDTDETSWEYNAERNIVTLTLKGGYASLDDFKFKRDYWVETVEDGYILRKLKEHYFTDFRKPMKNEKKLSH